MAEPINVGTIEGQALLKQKGIRPLPAADDLTQPYWAAARRHELRIQRCHECGRYQHPPQTWCGSCPSTDVRWERISGRGTVYSYIVDHRLMMPGFSEPYIVALVVPEEAGEDTVRITANVMECEAGDAYIGMPVEAVFQRVTDEVTLPQFRPAPTALLRSRGETPVEVVM